MKKPLLGLIGIAALFAVVLLSPPAANPIAKTNGIVFLLLYGFVVAITLWLCWAIARSLDTTQSLSPPPVAKDPDPYEIAYLRNGTPEVTRLAVFNLIQRHYLYVLEEDKIAQLPEHPDVNSLSPLEWDIFYWFSSPRPAKEIDLSSLAHRIEQHCTVYRQNLHIKKLLFDCPKDAVVAFWLGRGIIVGLGAYKIILALVRNEFSIGLLLAIAIGVALIVLQRICRTPRLSARGQKYLARLQRTFEKLNISQEESNSNSLAVAAFGLSVLSKTPYAFVEKLFA